MTKPASTQLTPVAQWLEVRRYYPAVTFRANIFTLPLTPTICSPTYLVRIDYARFPRRPVVDVLRPAIRPDAPHTFKPGRDLCLYYHGEWTTAMSFARSIVPWTEEWLYYYERWLEHGRWEGPEAPHGPPKETR